MEASACQGAVGDEVTNDRCWEVSEEIGVSYIKSTVGNRIDFETIETLVRLAGFTVPPEDISLLAEALRDQLASIEQLDRLDLADVNPALEFDPRWD
jgi:hypothetical protein